MIFFGSGALDGKMLLIRVIEKKKKPVLVRLGQVKVSFALQG